MYPLCSSFAFLCSESSIKKLVTVQAPEVRHPAISTHSLASRPSSRLSILETQGSNLIAGTAVCATSALLEPRWQMYQKLAMTVVRNPCQLSGSL